MRLFISLSYNGGNYSGWQSQTNADSIQERVEKALSIAFREKISVTGAGRTDAGVNAVNYIAHFDTSPDTVDEPDKIVRKINAILPLDIYVDRIFIVPYDAHARFDALSRTYNYFVHTEKDPFADRSYYYSFPLDFNAMNTAASFLAGRMDFSSFEKIGGGNKTSFCTVSEAVWEKIDSTHYVFRITADRFLRNMVRAVVGTLLEIGRGKHGPEWIKEVIDARDRGCAGQSVPGEALFLSHIEYPYQLISKN